MNYIQIFKTFFSQLGKTREYILKFAALPFSFLGMTADDLMELCINPKDSYTNLSNFFLFGHAHANRFDACMGNHSVCLFAGEGTDK